MNAFSYEAYEKLRSLLSHDDISHCWYDAIDVLLSACKETYKLRVVPKE